MDASKVMDTSEPGTLTHYLRNNFGGAVVIPEGGLSIMNTQVGGNHYTKMAIQPIAYIFANDIGFAEGNIIKYVSRYRNKNGLEDLKKARHMLNLLIERWETDTNERTE